MAILRQRKAARRAPGLAFAGLAALLLAGAAESLEPLRIASQAFDARVEIEVRDLPRPEAEAAVEAAVQAILEVEDLVDPRREGPRSLARLNAAAGKKPVAVDLLLLRLLARAQDFCIWSRGAHGPLGGELYDLWGLRGPVEGRPTEGALAAAARTAGCDGLGLDAASGRAQLAAGSRIELVGFGPGFAVDRAVEVLREHGVANAWVELGSHRYGLGPGPKGAGWKCPLPVLDDPSLPEREIFLWDQALSTRRFDDSPFRIAGDAYPSLLDQRTGRPPQGIESVTVLTELAVDSQALAGALMILGNREGQMRLGGLRPKPAVLWLLGDGTGRPVMTTYQWSRLRAVR